VLTIDGSFGEGGGQIIRTALSLSLVTGTPFRAVNVRAGRRKPGLMRQHLTAVEAAARIGGAKVEGAAVGSREILFEPGTLSPGEYLFSIGTAGSATLVLQTVLPALLRARAPSHLIVEGGTHNPLAPTFGFLEKAFLPLVSRSGPKLRATLERPGFFPAGGGRFTVSIEPSPELAPLALDERGEIRSVRARAMVAHLPGSIARRELAVVAERLGWDDRALEIVQVEGSAGPGNVLELEVESEHLCEVFTGFGERGVRAETVAERATDEVRRYLASGAPVGAHLCDQLIVPMALAGSGRFRTLSLSEHARTQMEIVRRFLGVETVARELGHDLWQVEVGSAPAGP
jgi:RNA 3'-terminal phosphate cyclase (ATP)